MKKVSGKLVGILSLIAFAILPAVTGFAATYDATGSWRYTAYNNWVNPGSAGCPPEPDHTYTISITQNGNDVIIVLDNITYTGSVVGAVYNVSASYAEDGGTTVDSSAFTLSSNDSGSGTVTWDWNASGYSCNGGCDITLERIGSSSPQNTYTGWWFDPTESGTGISIEVQGSMLFLAWYVFDSQGQPVWYTSGGAMTDSETYSGAILEWTGPPLESTYYTPQSSPVGSIQIIFQSSDQASVSWSVGSIQGTMNIVRFLDVIAPGQKDSRDIHGWWWNPLYSGTGVFIECQGGMLFMAWYHYSNDEIARWWSSGNPFINGSNTYNGVLTEWSNGKCLGCRYRPPIPSSAPGDVSLQFTGESEAVLTWAGGSLNIERFRFGVE